MWLDERTEFCDATQLSTTGTGLRVTGDQIDLTTARDIGNGEPVYWCVEVDTAITSTGSATVNFKLVSDGTAALSTAGTSTVHAETGAIAKASLVAGYKTAIAIPMEGNTYERYLGVLIDVGTAKLSAGKINSFLTKDVAKWKAYADAI